MSAFSKPLATVCPQLNTISIQTVIFQFTTSIQTIALLRNLGIQIGILVYY